MRALAALFLALGLAFSALAAGAPEIAPGQLPKEAHETLAKIRAGGPFRYKQDGVVFGNRERLLPQQKRGYYREYTVPTPGAKDRGARRSVAGAAKDYWYTDDHYKSFSRIRE